MEYICLNDIAKYKQGKQVSIDKQHSTCLDGMVRFVRIVDYTNSNEMPRYIENLGQQYIVDEKSIVMIRYGSQTAGKVVRGISGIIANNMFQISIDDDRFDNDYMYYFLSSSVVNQLLMGGQSSSTMPAITFGMLKQIQVPVRSIDEQRKIASVLESIDKKIENNNKINDNLQQQALAIFHEWFIANSESGKWPLVTLDSLTSLVSRGIAPKYFDDSMQIVLNQKCIRDHYIDVSLARRHKPKIINEKWLQYGDLLINSTGEGTLGRAAQVWFVPENMTVDSHVTIVRPRNKLLRFYIGFWGVSHEREIEALHTGSTGQTELPRDRVRTMELHLPDNDALTRFNEVIAPMVSAIIANQRENARLAELRDSLLPRLMNGEIDVSNIDI